MKAAKTIWELSRKFGLFRGELPVPMEHVAQAKNAHTHGEPLVAHIGASPKCAVQGGSPWVWAFWLARRAPWVQAVPP